MLKGCCSIEIDGCNNELSVGAFVTTDVLLEPTQRPGRIAGIIVCSIWERVIIVVSVYWDDC